MEWIAAERRLVRGRSAADIAAEPTPEERERTSDAMTAYYVRLGERKDAEAAHQAAIAARIESQRGPFGASTPKAEAQALLDAQDDAKAEAEAARKREGEALVRMNAVKGTVDRARQARRAEAQAGINRAGYLANVVASGGDVDQDALDRHYPQPGRLVAALQRVRRRVRP